MRLIYKIFFVLPFVLSAIGCYGADSDKTVMTIDGQGVSCDEFLYMYRKNLTVDSLQTPVREYANLFATYRMKVMEAEAAGIDTLPEFREELSSYYSMIPSDDYWLRKEYRDGMLLFEISNRTVWQKSLMTPEALQAHFETNRDRFVWDEPRAKGWILFGENSEMLSLACDYLQKSDVAEENYVDALRSHFGKSVMARRYVVKQGIDPLVDALVFKSGDMPALEPTWKVACPFCFRVLNAPEEWNDVKGPVTADYQESLTHDWETHLWLNHSVVLNYEVIDEIAGLL